MPEHSAGLPIVGSDGATSVKSQRARYRLSIVKICSQLYKARLLCRTFQSHQLNQTLFKQRSQIHRYLYILASGRISAPYEEGFELDHKGCDPELNGQRDSDFF